MEDLKKGHLFYATSNFMHYFKSIWELKSYGPERHKLGQNLTLNFGMDITFVSDNNSPKSNNDTMMGT